MGLLEYAEQELKAIGMWDTDNEYDGLARDSIMELVETFANQGHSGFSASYVRDIVHNLFAYEPLAPLTGEDDEWNEVGDGLYQNRRCSRVFKDETGVYDIDGQVFILPNGVAYTNNESRVPVEFPYIPKTEYVYVDVDGNVLNPQPEEG